MQTTFQLPFCVTNSKNKESILEFGRCRQALLKEVLKIHGAILLRGFDVSSPKEFEHFAREFSDRDLFNYAGGASPRTVISSSGLYTSTEYPPSVRIPLHNELSYSQRYPRLLFFLCVTSSDSGGETMLGDSRKILAAIDKEIVARFTDKGICYIRNLGSGQGSGYSWQDAFETDSPREVEVQCKKIGAQFDWLEDGGLRLTQLRPATAVHSETGDKVWFNQADGFHSGFSSHDTMPRLDCCFGDGSLIKLSDLRAIRKAIDRETVAHKWKENDLMIVDNLLSAHGRMPFNGERKIILAMA
jgi:alpha-ketoglutarate-dependent taurine dioxygenase